MTHAHMTREPLNTTDQMMIVWTDLAAELRKRRIAVVVLTADEAMIGHVLRMT